MLKSGDYARCYAHFLWLCSHLRSFFIVHYAKKGYSAQCCAHVFCCFACSSLSGETSPKVATQMARDHARLPPDVDTPILYYHPSSDSACKGTKHTLALTSVKLPAEESPYNNSSAKTWNSLIYNGSYPSNYRTQQTSPLVGTCYIRPYRYPPFSVHDKARRSGMIPCNYNVQISKIDFKSARKNPNPSTKNYVL